GASGASRGSEFTGTGVPGGRGDALFRGGRRGRAPHRRGRQDLRRLRLLLGPADSRARASGSARSGPGGRGGGPDLRGAGAWGGRARGGGAPAGAVGRAGAVR